MIYFIQNTETQDVKIGYTKSSPQKRLGTLQSGSSARLEIIALMEGDHDEERALHRLFSIYHRLGEWFSWSPQLLYFLLGIEKSLIYLDPIITGLDMVKPLESKEPKPFRRYDEFKVLYDQGLGCYEIALEMGLSMSTVRHYRRKMESYCKGE